MNIYNLPALTFVSNDPDQVVAELVNEFTRQTGRRLAEADPVRLFLLTVANSIVLLKNEINETGRQNLLRYATGASLDHIGALVGVERLAPLYARATIKYTLSAIRDVDTTIPRGTRVTAGDNYFFAAADDVVIKAGQTEGTGESVSVTPGAKGNGYAIGELATIVDPVPYVAKAVNTNASAGGADLEDDEHLRERIALAPESFSSAGPSGAYEFYTKKANSNIADVAVVSPVPGDVVIYPLMNGGGLPESQVLKEVAEACNDRAVRPLTDHVSAKAPTVKNYEIKATYYIRTADGFSADTIKKNVMAAADSFEAWQKSKLGRDINPAELTRRIMEAGVKRVEITEPVYTTVKNGRQAEGYGVEVAVATDTTLTFGGLEDD